MVRRARHAGAATRNDTLDSADLRSRLKQQFWPRRSGRHARKPRLVIQQPAFARQAAAVAGQRAIGPDDAVTRDHDGHGVRAVGQADGAASTGAAEAFGKLAVAARRAGWD